MNEHSGLNLQAASQFLEGGGKCGALIAARDWARTALGPLPEWPQSLKTATAILLRSTVPMVMLWGEDGVMLYNDAYSVFAGGRHPELLGSTVREGWPEVADFNDNVMKVGLAGGTLAYRDQEMILYRHGVPEHVWMNLDYSPVLDESGRPGGVLAIVVDTTERVTAERAVREREERLRFFDDLGLAIRALSDPFEIMGVTAEMLGQHMNASVCAYADMEPDEDGFTIRGDWAAPGSKSIVGRYSLAGFGETAVRELHAGRPLVTRNTLEELGPVEGNGLLSLGLNATVCMPFIKAERLTALMAVHQAEPRDWTDADLALIAEATERSWAYIERTRSQAMLAFQEEQLRLAIDAGEIGQWDLDLVGGTLFWPPRVNAMFGLAPDAVATMDDFYAGLHPEDRDATAEAFGSATDPTRRAIYDVEYRTIGRDDGLIRWVAAKGRGIFDERNECVRVIGTAIDISARKRAEQHQRLLIDELSHRSKNLLAIVQAVAQQSFKGDRSPDQIRAIFEGRLGALSAAHGILTRERWENVAIRKVIEDTLAAIRPVDGRIDLTGPDILIPPKTGVSLAMAVHELATNALKYGSLSDDNGRVAV
ncbi:MAG TPA: HWE histidine kinase domain-containing protein, partial [Sphingomicrobium sp.]